MSAYNFLFTYTVSPKDSTTTKITLADNVRKNIASLKVHEWTKLATVETTFSGVVYLTNSTTNGKRTEAEKLIKNILREVIDKQHAYLHISVDVALMVNGLGEHIEFKV